MKEPKFKVGDKVRVMKGLLGGTISSVKAVETYPLWNGNHHRYILADIPSFVFCEGSIEPVGNSDQLESQTAKADSGKPKLTLVPRKILTAIARIREYGCKKYKDPENWRKVEKERYRDAAFRHFMAYLDDPTGVDEESGLPHLWHLACNVAFLVELEENEVKNG